MAHVLDTLLAMPPKGPPPVVFVGDDGKDAIAYTPGELVGRARSLAGMLQKQERLAPGDRVALVYPPGMDFVVGFVGAMLAGLIPVPVYPPRPGAPAEDLPKLDKIMQSCGAHVALTTRRYRWGLRLGSARDLLLLRGAVRTSIRWVTTDDLAPDLWAPRPLATPAPDDVAFLQFTSGSTGQPKGVMITHGNLAHQLEMNAQALGMGPDARFAAWVPQYHDLGLISGLMSALVGNGRLWFLSPLAFLRDPGVWFDLVTRIGATHTAAPNFGYELVVKKTTPERRSKWNLSTLRIAMSAGEPVRAGTIDRFVEAMCPYGLNPSAMCPAYGLAEHTVGITIGGRARLVVDRAALRAGRVEPHAGGVELVGCGAPGRGVEVRIVDGEIWARSPSTAAGYWGLPAQSEDAFAATLPGEPGRWLRTGDLGFLDNGELYVTGRLRDLIIVRGRNVFPEDLEDEARQAHADVRPGGIAAFGIPGESGEEVALLVEARDGAAREDVGRAVIDRIRRVNGVAVSVVGVGAPGIVPRTTSGKVQRAASRQAWIDGSFSTHLVRGEPAVETGAFEEMRAMLAAAAPTDRAVILERALLDLAATHLGLKEPPSPDTPLDALGIDSMQAVDLAEELALLTERAVSPRMLLEARDLGAVAKMLASD